MVIQSVNILSVLSNLNLATLCHIDQYHQIGLNPINLYQLQALMFHNLDLFTICSETF